VASTAGGKFRNEYGKANSGGGKGGKRRQKQTNKQQAAVFGAATERKIESELREKEKW